MNQLFQVEQSERTSDDYLTPRWVFETMGIEFDLDVASPPWDTYVPATEKLTQLENGLLTPWHGRVWMNPPYSNSSPWVDRFMEHHHGVCLVPHSRSAWWGRLWMSDAAIADGGMFRFHAPSGKLEPVFMPVVFAAFGDECVEAISRLGRVR